VAGEILRLARRGGLAQDGHPSPDVQLSVLSIKKMRKKERGAARFKNVGAPTMLIDVVVNAGVRIARL
jgi:hypothetical protein